MHFLQTRAEIVTLITGSVLGLDDSGLNLKGGYIMDRAWVLSLAIASPAEAVFGFAALLQQRQNSTWRRPEPVPTSHRQIIGAG